MIVQDKKLRIVPWDMTEVFRMACGTEQIKLTQVGSMVLNPQNQDPNDLSPCKLPFWWEQKEDYLEKLGADVCEKGITGGNWFSAIPFSCDPVGALMGIAWKERFFDRMEILLGLVNSQKLQEFQSNRLNIMSTAIYVDILQNNGFPNDQTTLGLWNHMNINTLEMQLARWNTIVSEHKSKKESKTFILFTKKDE